MPISILPDAAGQSDDDILFDTNNHSSNAIAQVSRHALSDILEDVSDNSSDDIPRSALAQPSAGAILQLIRDSAYEILESTGGQSPHPTSSAADNMADDQTHMQNISRISDDIVRNLARILEHRADEGDRGMKDVIAALPPAAAPAVASLPAILRDARRPALNRRASRLVCRDSQSIATLKWRPGPQGPATLCNVCGLLYAKRMGIVQVSMMAE